MKKEITSLTALESEGKKIAKLVANRQIRRSIQTAKKKSLRKYGQAVPAIIVDAKTVLDQGLGILDFQTCKPIPAEEVDNYVVVLDGAHRLDAHFDLLKENKDGKCEYTNDFYFMFPLRDNLDIGQLLAEINTCTTPWRGGDYAMGASMMISEDLPVLSFITELAQKGCSLHAASIWAALVDSITKGVIIKAMNGTVDECLKATVNLEYGKKLYYLAAKKFAEKFMNTRTLPDWVLKILNTTPVNIQRSTTVENIAAFFTDLSKEDAEEISNMKGSSGGETKEALVNRKLDELYQAYQNKSE